MIIKHKDFEDYLMDYFGQNDGRMFLDDDLPDAFDNWLCNLEPDEWIKLGDLYYKTANERDTNKNGVDNGT